MVTFIKRFFTTQFSAVSENFTLSPMYSIIEAKLNIIKREIEDKYNEDFTIIIEGDSSALEIYTNSISGQTHEFSIALIRERLK
jgi:hypothetical protein